MPGNTASIALQSCPALFRAPRLLLTALEAGFRCWSKGCKNIHRAHIVLCRVGFKCHDSYAGCGAKPGSSQHVYRFPIYRARARGTPCCLSSRAVQLLRSAVSKMGTFIGGRCIVECIAWGVSRIAECIACGVECTAWLSIAKSSSPEGLNHRLTLSAT